jgi:general secretion pathway protein A
MAPGQLRGYGWLIVPAALLAASGAATSEPAFSRTHTPSQAPSFNTVVEVEQAARLLAVLLDSGRDVVNDNQDLFDNPEVGDKGFSPPVFERQLIEMFRGHSGIDLRDLDGARLPPRTKTLLAALVAVSKQVVAAAQSDLNRKGVGFKGFVPAVFGARVAAGFSDLTGVRLKQTSLAPRNPANAPDAFEKAVLEQFADPAYPREKIISEVTAKGGPLRLMMPLYTTRRCLDCHGEPKGERDRTGYPKEGLRLGQNAGAISVAIPLSK